MLSLVYGKKLNQRFDTCTYANAGTFGNAWNIEEGHVNMLSQIKEGMKCEENHLKGICS